MFFCSSIYIETAQNSSEECNEFADLLFVRLSIIMPFKSLFVLWHSLSRSLYFIQVYIFIPLIHCPILARFSHILVYTNFFLMYITSQNIFLIPDDSVARNLIIILISVVKGLIWTIFSFLTFIALIQWNFPWNISANLPIFTNKTSSHVVIV